LLYEVRRPSLSLVWRCRAIGSQPGNREVLRTSPAELLRVDLSEPEGRALGGTDRYEGDTPARCEENMPHAALRDRIGRKSLHSQDYPPAGSGHDHLEIPRDAARPSRTWRRESRAPDDRRPGPDQREASPGPYTGKTHACQVVSLPSPDIRTGYPAARSLSRPAYKRTPKGIERLGG
jgi:hypothetical protein